MALADEACCCKLLARDYWKSTKVDTPSRGYGIMDRCSSYINTSKDEGTPGQGGQNETEEKESQMPLASYIEAPCAPAIRAEPTGHGTAVRLQTFKHIVTGPKGATKATDATSRGTEQASTSTTTTTTTTTWHLQDLGDIEVERYKH